MIKPTADRVLLSVVATDAVTPGGLFIPEGAREKTAEAIVTAVGSAVSTLASGDRVVYHPYSGTPISYEGAEYLLVPVLDVLAVIED